MDLTRTQMKTLQVLGGLLAFVFIWGLWALVANALVQKFYPTRTSDSHGQQVMYSIIVKLVMIAPLLALGFAVSFFGKH